MSLNKRGLSFCLLLTAVLSIGLVALPLRTLEAKGLQTSRHSAVLAVDSASAISEKVDGPGAYHFSMSPNPKWPKSSLLASLFLPLSTGSPLSLSNIVGDRIVRIVGTTLSAGQDGTVSIEIDSQGNENALGFSINFDQTKLTYVSAARGTDATSATMNVNPNSASIGRLGFALALSPGFTFSAGTRQLVVVTFAVAASGNGSTAISFGDAPIGREIVDAAPAELTATYAPGTINILALPAPVPTLTSLSPTSTTTGGTSFNLTVNGTGFVSTSVVRFNGIDRLTTFVNSTQLTVEINAADIQAAGSFPISVSTPAPGGGTTSALNFAVNNATLTSLSPSSATAGGLAFTLTTNGSGFVSTSVVRLNGSDRPTTVINNTQLTAQINAADIQTAGSFPVTVATTSGVGSSNAINLAVDNSVPTIAALSPSSVLAGGPAFALTVTGTGFSGSSGVRVNGIDRPTSFVSSSQLTAQIAAADISAVGTAIISVLNPTPGGGTSNTLSFAIINLPASRVVRAVGATFQVGQNNSLSVELDSLGDENALGFSLNFDPAKLSFVSVGTGSGSSGATLNVNPLNAGSGQLGIAIAKSAGEVFPAGTRQIIVVTFNVPLSSSGSIPISFGDVPIGREVVNVAAAQLGATYTSGSVIINYPLPTLSNISPSSVIGGGAGLSLTVNGNNFVSESVVKFNGSDRPTVFVNATQLTAQLSAADLTNTGAFPISVVTPAPGGGATSAVHLTVSSVPMPSITNLAPTTVTAGGSDFTLTVNGANFLNGSQVRFNGIDRATTFVSNAQLHASILAADIANAGNIPVTVFNPAPGGGTSNAITLAVDNPVPTIAALSPSSTLAGGLAFTLTVNGTNFSGSSVVRFNGSARSTSFITSSQLTAQITAADIQTPGTGMVTVFNPAPGGGTSNALSFTTNANPALRIIRVAGATFQAGQDNSLSIQLDSQGDENSLGFSLTFDPAKLTFVSASQGSDAASATLNVNSNAAASGRVGIGLGLSTGSSFAVGTRQILVFIFNVPTSAAGGPTVVGFGDSPVGREVVDTNAGTLGATFTSGSVSITALPAPVPVLTSISPTSGVAGGPAFNLTVAGSNFVSGSVVRWNGADRTTSFVNNTQLTAQITAADIATAGTATVTVSSPAPGGGVSGAASFSIVTANPVPSVSGLLPSSATAGGVAFTLAVNGSNFISASVVRWNGADRVTNFVSSSQLTAQITAADIATAGTATVTLFNPAPGGGVSGAASFSIIPPNPVPSVSGLLPSSATAGGVAFPLTVNGGNFVNGSIVRWNGANRTTSFVSSSQLTAQITAADIQTPGTGMVTVFNPAPGGGTSNALSFTTNANPALRIVRVAGTTFQAGQNNSLSIQLDSQGDENSLGFSLTFDPAKLTFVSASQGSDAASATLNVNSNAAASGRVGIALGLPTSSSFAVGTRQILVFIFNVPTSAAGGPTVVGFGDSPVGREVVDTNAGTLGATFTSGSVSITALPAPVPVLTSISPTSGVAGGPAFNLTVAGSNFVSGSVVRWNGADRTTSFVNSSQLTAQITAADIATAGTATVTVSSPAPGGGVSGAASFSIVTANPVPSVSGLLPSSATAGGTAFTLAVNGSNFISASVVRWNGADRVTNFVSSSQLTAQITAADIATAGTATVTLFNPAPGGGVSGAASFSIIPPNPVPSVSGLLPSSATAGGVTFTLTVNGGNFVNGSIVRWNGANRTTSFVSSSQLTAQITAADIQTPGTGMVTVFNPAPGGGTSNALSFTTNANPALRIVRVAGTTFQAGQNNSLSIQLDSQGDENSLGFSLTFDPAKLTFVSASQGSDAASATLNVNSNAAASGRVGIALGLPTSSSFAVGTRQILVFIFNVPTSAAGGPTVVGFGDSPVGREVVDTNAGTLGATFTSDSVSITALPAPVPVLTSISPTSGVAGGPAFNLTVAGSNFVSWSVVRWNGADRTTSFVNSSQLTAQITAADIATAGTATVTVSSPAPGGGVSGAASFSIVTANPVPSVSGLLPSSATAGGTAFTLAVNGSNFISASVVRWNGADRVTNFVSSSQLTAQITAADIATAGTATVTLFNPAPGGGVSGAASFSIIPPNPVPSVSGLLPSSATAGGVAFPLTVNGGNFVNGSIVRWNGANRTTSFVSSSQLTAQITAADIQTPGTGMVTVFNPAPGGGTSNALSFTTNANPALRIVRVAGTNFQAGQNNSLSIQLDSQGDENSLGFSLTFDPAKLTFVSASQGSDAASATLNVNSNAAASGRVGIALGLPTSSSFAVGTRQILVFIFNVPTSAAGGPTVVGFGDSPVGREVVDTNASTLGATFTSGSVSITALPAPVPVLTSISPTSGVAGGPAFNLTVAGSNFVSGSVVRWNGADRTTSFVSNTQLTAQITAADLQTAGNAAVTVFNPAPAGGTSSPINLAINNPAPTISNLATTNATVGGAAFALTVNGSNFVNGSVVKWNGSNRTTSFVSSTQLTASISAADLAAAGSFQVMVANPAPGGGDSTTLDFAVNNPAPTISNLAPTSAAVGGAAFDLIVNGNNFVNGAVVKWNGSDRVTTFVSSSQLSAQITAGDIQSTATSLISVFNPVPGGGASGNLDFSVINPVPSLSSLAPASANLGEADSTLTVHGAGFVNGVVVKFNGSNRTTGFVSSTQLTVVITAADLGVAGNFPVMVANPAPGGGNSSTVNFTVNNPAPTISNLSATSAEAGDPAFTLTVNGTNFVNGSIVRFEGNNHATIFVSATQLTTQITAADLQDAGTFQITVFNPAPGGGSSDVIIFNVIGPNPVPVIGGLAPATVTVGGAAFPLTVNGSKFVTGSVVNLDGNDRTTTFVSSTQLTAQITLADRATAGVFALTVVNPAPGGGTSNVVSLNVNNPTPTITNLDPANATVGAAAFSLTVNGSNFISGAVVKFNGSERTTGFVSSTQLTAAINAADLAAAGTFPVLVVNPAPGGGSSTAANFTVINPAPEPAKFQFASADYNLQESQNSIEITVTRTGDTSSAATVDFATDDSATGTPCVVPTGGADQRCDYSTTGGTLSFAAGETSKTFTLLNTDDAYVEGYETLTLSLGNPAEDGNNSSSSVITLGSPAVTTLTILDNDMAPPTNNPINTAEYFVNQHYIDFMSRIPDPGGLAYWTDEIARCGTDATCIHRRRIAVSAAFFVEREFQMTGSVVYRLYKAAYGQRPAYAKFMPDRSQLVEGLDLPASTLVFANRFAARPEFKAAYPNSMTPADFVNHLFDTAAVNDSAERAQAINALLTGSKTRAQVLLDLIEIQEFKQREYNPSFVLMQYFGYLRREPDDGGYLFWLDVVNNRATNNYGAMVCAFITSKEYQERFSSVVTRSNQDCAQ